MLKMVKLLLVVAAVVGGILAARQLSIVDHGKGNVVQVAIRDEDFAGSQR